MHLHRSGWRPGETHALHSRQRFRLVKALSPNLPPCDESLWIIHYTRANPEFQYSVNQLPITAPIRATMSQRSYLQQHGQLVRKEFMLHDRNNWPTINLPGSNLPPYRPAASAYPANVMQHMSRAQQQSYLQQQQFGAAQGGMGPSPAKRQRHGHPGNPLGYDPSMAAQAIDDDDYTDGDFMDSITPREISAMRYKQHHEWLDEIINSPYANDQIVPGGLGLGRAGELKGLTEGFFDTPMKERELGGLRTVSPGPLLKYAEEKKVADPPKRAATPPHVGRMEAGKASDFAKKANEKIAEMRSEIERMKRQYARRLEELGRNTLMKDAEQRLRAMGIDPVRPSNAQSGQDDPVEEIKQSVEASTGRKIEAVREVKEIERGGREEKVDARENDEQDYDMVDPAANLDLQEPPMPTYTMASESASATQITSDDHIPQVSYQPPPGGFDGGHEIEPAGTGAEASAEGDITMDELQSATEPKDTDWIIVNKDRNSHSPHDADLDDLVDLVQDPVMQPNVESPGEAQATPANDLADFAGAGTEGTVGGYEGNEFDEAIDFANVGSTEEMPVFEEGDHHMDLSPEEPLIEGSAFGDAFHGPDTPVDQRDDVSRP